MLRELQERLGHSEQKVTTLTAENRQLREAGKYTEEMFKQAKQQNGYVTHTLNNIYASTTHKIKDSYVMK